MKHIQRQSERDVNNQAHIIVMNAVFTKNITHSHMYIKCIK